ncbi:MAG TPA: hypothetical protein VE526_00795 [Solirubrobacteraceae bacterium]|nr:hypothetical protein [Solirubrobacteraceae bacterium]
MRVDASARPSPSRIVQVLDGHHSTISAIEAFGLDFRFLPSSYDEGFRVSEDAVRYLREARDLGGAIVARDTSLTTLRVL